MTRILFLCTRNSCRSQMAEGWARHLLGSQFEVTSAGSEPSTVDPRATVVMAEVGINISAQSSKSVEAFKDAALDHVFTLCGDARDRCPAWPGNTTLRHHGFDDPPGIAKPGQSEEEILQHYRRVRDEIGGWIKTLAEELPPSQKESSSRQMHGFERLLTLWVFLCMGAGILLGRVAPGFARALDRMTLDVDGAPVVSIPIAVCLFFMMYPIMVKIDFAEVVVAGKSTRPVLLTLFINWCVKPFTMLAISSFFLGTLFLSFIGPDATDLVKLPFGLDLPEGAVHGAGRVVMQEGVKLLEIPLWRSYLAGCILLGVAPCTAMVLVWGYLARGSDAHTLVMVAINSLMMLVLYGVLGGFLLGVGRLPVPWQALLLSIGIYVALPLVAGFVSRRWIIAAKGEQWFREKFLHVLTPVTIGALLLTLLLLFSFKGDVILENPLTILWIAVPLTIQTLVIFAISYALARVLGLRYADAAPTAMIGASNHFEVAIATAAMLFGLSSGAALATVVGVLIEVPLMLALVKFCLRTQSWFPEAETARHQTGSVT